MMEKLSKIMPPVYAVGPFVPFKFEKKQKHHHHHHHRHRR
jgi:hypothetical protein